MEPTADEREKKFLAELKASSDPERNVEATSYEMFAEELGAYRDGTAYARIPKDSTVSDLVKRIDKIDSSLVAKVKVTDLFASCHASFWCSAAFCPTLQLALPDNYEYKGLKAREPPRMTNPDEAARYRKKKRMTTGQAKNLTSMVSAALRSLATECKLFEVWTHPVAVDVGAFFVEKAGDANLLRVIIDGRFANLVYSTSAAKFSFFSLETLRQVIDNLSKCKKWFAINIDLRHWFHEIPLPNRYKKIFGLPLTDRGNERGEYYLVPRAFPMGWSFSPVIAQTMTWGLVLSKWYDPITKTGDPDFAAAADLDLQELRKHTELFSWVPLKSGGGIFILLDNILIVTPQEDTAKFWFDKIKRDAKRYDITLKTKPNPDSPATEDELLLKQCFHEMTSDSSTTFDFLGITWSHSSHWIKIDPETEDLLEPNATKGKKNVQEDGTWIGTYTELASIIGRINWHRRAHGLRNFDDESDKYGTVTLLSLFATMTPPAGKNYQSIIGLGKKSKEGLTRAWRFRCGMTPCLARPMSWNSAVNSMRWFATDAAKNARNNRYVIVEYDVKIVNGVTLVGNAPKGPVFTDDFLAGDSIALGELYAIVEAICTVTDPHTLIILATDSMNAKRWVEAAKAGNATARSYLRKLFAHMDKFNLRVYLVYVPSKKNAADYATRPHLNRGRDMWEPQTFNETKALLSLAEAEAKKMWIVHGAQSGGMDPSLNSNGEENKTCETKS